MMKRLALAVSTIVIAVAPTSADQLLPQGQIDNSGNVKFGPLTLGKRQSGKTILTPDALSPPSSDNGSVGNVSGMSVTSPGAGAVARTNAQRAADRLSIADFLVSDPVAAFSAAKTAAGSSGAVEVREQYAPGSSVGTADATWLMVGRGAKTPLDNLRGAAVRIGQQHNTCAYPSMTGGTTGGFFSSYNCTGPFSVVNRQSYGSAITDRPFIIDGGFFHTVDADTAAHPETSGSDNNRAITNGLRSLVVGPAGGSSMSKQYKDLVGLDAHAIGRIEDPLRGTSGIAAGAIQYGQGIASNEFAAQNPSPADFGLAANSWDQSKSMAAIQAILRPHYADVDAGHVARAALIGNDQGFLASAGLELYSAAHGTIAARDGAFIRGLDMGNAKVRDSAIRMPASRTPGTNSGTLIEYDTNDWTDFIRDTNIYRWIIGGGVSFGVTPSGISIGSATDAPTTRAFVEPPTTTKSQIRLNPGTGPDAPKPGDVWNENGNLAFGGSGLLITTPSTPASSTAACRQGTIKWDASYTYVCVAANTWKRSALATW